MSSVYRCTRPKPFSEDFILSQKVAEKHFHLSFWSFWPIPLLSDGSFGNFFVVSFFVLADMVNYADCSCHRPNIGRKFWEVWQN